MILCPKCGTANREAARCCRCGSALPDHSKSAMSSGSKRMILGLVLLAVTLAVFCTSLLFLSSPNTSQSSALGTPSISGAPSVSGSRSGDSRPRDAVPSSVRATAVDGGTSHSVILLSDGTVVTLGDDTYAQRSTSGWSGITQISTFANHTLGLNRNGTVVAAGLNSDGQCNVSGWRDIVSVAAGSRHSVGVRSDGTVVAVGANEAGQCNVSHWQNVKSVAASNTTTFGLTHDGRILVAGSFSHRNTGSWSQIDGISVSTNHVAVVHVNGTVSVAGSNDQGQCENMAKWSDCVQVAAGYGFTAGLRQKGTVWVHGCDAHNEHAAMQWTDIIAIGSGCEHLLGIRSDGTVIATGTNDYGQCDVYDLNQRIRNS